MIVTFRNLVIDLNKIFVVMKFFFDDSVKNLTFETLSALSVKVFAIVCVFLMNLVIVRQIGASESGIFFLCLAIVTFLANIGRFGLDGSVVRFISVANAREDRASVYAIYIKARLWANISCVALGFLLFIFKGPVCEVVFGKPDLEPVMALMAFTIPLIGIYTIQASSLQGLEKVIQAMITLSLIVPLVTLVAIFVFGVSNAIEMAIIYLIACAVTLCFGYFFWRFSTLKGPVSGVFSSMELLQSCVPLWSAVFCNQITVWSSLLLLGVWGSAEDVSYLAIAQRIAMLTTLVLIASNVITSPKIAVASSQNEPEKLVHIARISIRIALAGAVPAFLLVVLWPKWLLSIFGTEFISATTALVILATGQLINNASGQVQGILSMTGNQTKLAQNSALAAVVSLSLGFALIPSYGLTGAALAQAFAVASNNILGVVQIKRIFGFNILYFWRSAS
jgi:O-antigen/teichoic acid export membrane protein